MTHIKVGSGEFIEIDRCETDGGLVFGTQGSLSAHGGHRLKQPVILTLWERLLIKTGVIDVYSGPTGN